MYMQKYSFRTKFLFIILLTKFSNKIEFPIHLYMVICQECNLTDLHTSTSKISATILQRKSTQ